MRGWLVLVATTALAAGGCYDQPRPNCTFTCGEAGACPADYQCGPDDLCHLVLAGGGLAECQFVLPDGPTDAPFDGPPPDASPDAPADAAADASPPDATVDASVPDAALPDAALIDAALPDAAMIDAALPDAALPDAALPDAAIDAA